MVVPIISIFINKNREHLNKFDFVPQLNFHIDHLVLDRVCRTEKSVLGPNTVDLSFINYTGFRRFSFVQSGQLFRMHFFLGILSNFHRDIAIIVKFRAALCHNFCLKINLYFIFCLLNS